MTEVVSKLIMIALLPVLVPLLILIGLMYSWEDTVPKPEDDCNE